ncbi:MAG: UvrD-helicase domain-containing protein [Rhizobiaceae bacterium]
MTSNMIPTQADIQISECLETSRSFAVVAGAGSGKTTSLVEALKQVREQRGQELRQAGQRIVCITYTNRAVDVISSRLKFDDLFLISTLHSFLWGEISRFQNDIREALKSKIIPGHLEKAQEKNTGRDTKTARKAKVKVDQLSIALETIDEVAKFRYTEAAASNYVDGIINHDDMIDIAAHLILTKPVLRKALGFKFPYIFVDEAQDTFDNVVEALNAVCADEGLPIVGYFGDPMQQIYDKRAGSFFGPAEAVNITKTENFRCSISVLNLLNAFRKDVKQIPAGENAERVGSVEMIIIQAPTPTGGRGRYSDEELTQVTSKFDEALEMWDWKNREGVKRLFLVRQMIARRQGFTDLHALYTGPFASSKAQDEYQAGTHVLLKPIIEFLYPLIEALKNDEKKALIEVFRKVSPQFHPQGTNAEKPFKAVLSQALEHAEALSKLWEGGTIRDLLLYCHKHALLDFSDRLIGHLKRKPRDEDFDDENPDHVIEKGDWLADAYFMMSTSEMTNYVQFATDNTPLSTQHGVKGEEYNDVLVVFDDVEAAWNQYSFRKTLTPGTAGEASEGQREKTEKLAYVCFSRAEDNLRILFFSQDAEASKRELVAVQFLSTDQINILN